MKNFKNIGVTLSRNEMRSVEGGLAAAPSLGGCCIAFGSASSPQWSCGYTVSQAQSYYAGGGRGYCCASC